MKNLFILATLFTLSVSGVAHAGSSKGEQEEQQSADKEKPRAWVPKGK